MEVSLTQMGETREEPVLVEKAKSKLCSGRAVLETLISHPIQVCSWVYEFGAPLGEKSWLAVFRYLHLGN